MKYEFEVIGGRANDLTDQLNELGNKGFYVVTHVNDRPTDPDDPSWNTVIMQRAIPESEDLEIMEDMLPALKFFLDKQ